jgi:hypothetical protein
MVMARGNPVCVNLWLTPSASGLHEPEFWRGVAILRGAGSGAESVAGAQFPRKGDRLTLSQAGLNDDGLGPVNKPNDAAAASDEGRGLAWPTYRHMPDNALPIAEGINVKPAGFVAHVVPPHIRRAALGGDGEAESHHRPPNRRGAGQAAEPTSPSLTR